jgi:hypothetical protein
MNAYMLLVGKSEGKIPPERPTCRWENSVKIDVREIVWVGMDWNNLA